MRQSKMLLMVMVLFALAVSSQALQTTAIDSFTITRETSGDSYVEIPLLTLDNAYVADTVNQAVRDALSGHLATLAVIGGGGGGSLQVDATAMILPSSGGHDVYTLEFSARGRMPSGRTGVQKIPLQFDLANAQPVTASAVFQDPPDAETWLETRIEDSLVENLSNYLDTEALLPVPVERFLLTQSGIRFYYHEERLTWLSGDSASLFFLYHELAEILNLEPDSLLFSLGIPSALQPGGSSAQSISDDVRKGVLPGLDAILGEPMDGLIDRHALQFDPEGFAEGQQYQFEDDSFRGTLALSLDGQTLNGLLSRRLNLHGLIVGKADRQAALKVMGEPAMSLPMPETASLVYRLPAGVMDVYPMGANELRLYYDARNLLSAVWLKQLQ